MATLLVCAGMCATGPVVSEATAKSKPPKHRACAQKKKKKPKKRSHGRAHRSACAKPKPKPKPPSSSAPQQTPDQTQPTTDGGDQIPPPNPPADTSQPCPDADLVPAPDNLDRVRAAVLCLVNQERAKQGMGALAFNAQLQKAGDDYTAQMVRDNSFSHDGRDGSNPTSRAIAAGYTDGKGAYSIGENLAEASDGGDSAAQIVGLWMGSPPHRANILDDSYRDLGLGMAVGQPGTDESGGMTFAAEFGARSQKAEHGKRR